jgi:ferredoxin
VRIVVDYDLCQGHQVCMSEAPEVFSVPADGQVQLLQESPHDGLRSKVELAVKYCPTHALKIVED